jgi:hypothetical protein
MDQSATANSGQTTAEQHITGSLSQVGLAMTDGAGTMTTTLGLAVQTVGILGFINPGQNQTMEGDGDAAQSQGVQVAGTESLTKLAGGWALGTGANTVTDLALTQDVAGTGTTGNEEVLISGTQVTSLVGAPNANGNVTASLSIIAAQNQKVGP